MRGFMAAECGSFGAALREHRLRRGLTQQAVAELAEVNVRTVRALEQGATREPEPSTASKLAVAVRLRWPPTELPLPAVRPPAQLPMDARGFVGRRRQLETIDELADVTRTVVITGTAGVGKTALGVHWSHRARTRFPDGQLYVDLRGYTQGRPVRVAEVLGRFLRACGVPAEQVPPEPEQALVLYQTLLASRKMLVLLDNAADPVQVEELVPDNPDCLTLITSRDRLGALDAERLDLDVMSPAEADVLLRRTLGEDRVSAEPAAAAELASLCAHLPLALRVAAANLADQPVRPIADQVAELRDGNRLASLAVEGDDQAAVRAAFELSYQRLSEVDKRLFRLLGLVPGQDFTAEAASALMGSDSGGSSEGLRRLAAAHLVDEHAPGRYAFHDLLRLYAAELAAGMDASGLYAWYLSHAAAAVRLLSPESLQMPLPSLPHVDFADPGAAVAWLDTELANMTAAITDCRSPALYEHTWQLADALRGHYWMTGNAIQWRAAGEAALQFAAVAGSVAGQAMSHFGLSGAYTRLNDYARSVRHCTAALEQARQDGWRLLESASLGTLTALHYEMGNLAAAEEYGREAIALGEELDASNVIANSLVNLGSVYLDSGEPEQAFTHYLRAYELAKSLDAKYVEALALAAVGTAHRQAGRPAEAYECMTTAIEMLESLGDTAYAGRALFHLAEVQVDLGDLPGALASATRAVELTPQGGDHTGESDAHRVLGTVLLAMGNRPRAEEHFRRTLVLAKASHARFGETEALIGLGRYDEALEIARAQGFRGLERQALARQRAHGVS